MANTAEDVWGSLSFAAKQKGTEIPDVFMQSAEYLALPVATIAKLLIPDLAERDVLSFEADVSHHYRELSDFPKTILYGGMEVLLAELKLRHQKSYIVTNKPLTALERILMLKQWGSFFDGWVSAEKTPEEYIPKGELFLTVIDGMGVKKDSSIVVGDSASDIDAAHFAGIRSIAVTYGDGDPCDLIAAKPHLIATSVQELTQLLLGGGKGVE
ncbi:HAD hydrolase-like protein [Collinsella sp. AGMB00827]|uniref:HAD hydrolase-like protein n=1 Tax=Collinsella ureilytica TaxID=2869515 RepID=A0ABS7MIY6_9ACTN|nr:HAD hydrolase-like protein [Collinsella urealyticum]